MGHTCIFQHGIQEETNPQLPHDQRTRKHDAQPPRCTPRRLFSSQYGVCMHGSVMSTGQYEYARTRCGRMECCEAAQQLEWGKTQMCTSCFEPGSTQYQPRPIAVPGSTFTSCVLTPLLQGLGVVPSAGQTPVTPLVLHVTHGVRVAGLRRPSSG